MTSITQILNWIANALLLPDIVLLLAALAASLIMLGGFLSGYLNFLRQCAARRQLLCNYRTTGKLDLAAAGDGTFGRHLAEMDGLGWDELECEKRIAEYTMAFDRELERARFLMKVGPMLGLMGTLIPMGPALAGLASGDIVSMAYNMQIAFATTVVGCFAAGVALLVYSTRRHWYAGEIADLRYILERRLRERGEA